MMKTFFYLRRVFLARGCGADLLINVRSFFASHIPMCLFACMDVLLKLKVKAHTS